VVPGSVDYVTPQSLNIDFQTGIAEGTLLTAGFRWTEFSAVDVIPTLLGSDLVDLDDSFRYSLGIARRFNDNFAGSLTLTYEPEGDGATVSPLGPTDGQFGITLGGRYTEGNMSISGGVNYTWLGDAFAGVADQPVASFSGSTALGIGLRIVGMVGEVVALGLELGDGGLQLGHRGRDVGQFDDVGLGPQREGTEPGQVVLDALVRTQALRERGDDPAGERDVG
jgi:hypothetical protein